MQAKRDTAAIETSRANLKQIGAAILAYHDDWQVLPPALIVDEQGRAHTSWRALILPYLDKEAAKSYDASAAWDDPRNAAALARAPKVLQSPRDGELSNLTSYVVVRGERTAFPDFPISLAAVMRGTRNTVFVLEIRNSDIPWAEPRDLDLASLSLDPAAPNSLNVVAGAVVLFGSGDVVVLPRGTTVEELTDLVDRRGPY